MRLFPLIKMRYVDFSRSIQDYLNGVLSKLGYKNSNSSIFSQLINVVSSSIQNILSYLEDALTEQNKFTATRKRSIYNLASISGYQPSLGTATTCSLGITFMPNNVVNSDIVIKNKTQFTCSQNGSTYNLILPQEAIILSPRRDNTTKYLTVVEGTFESQTFNSIGGELYTINLTFPGDCDVNYIEVYVNDELWECRDSLYDMDPEAKQYTLQTSLKKGVDIVFGNGQFGKALKEDDVIKVNYLIHHGEIGNINSNEAVEFEFKHPLQDTLGNDIDGNSVFNISVFGKQSINSGTYSEDYNQVKNMIGLNSRSLVLADAKNYKLALNRFSFVGYNRTWSEPGSLIINSLVLANFKNKMSDGLDYFNLKESDFYISDQQKDSIKSYIGKTGQQLAGSIYNIFDAEVVKYAMYLYVKLKPNIYDTQYITNQIRTLIGNFFADINSDIFIPKSDIVHLLKSNIKDIDGVNVYFISDLNEQALKNHYYIAKDYSYDPSRGTYNIHEEKVYLYGTENPNLGLDSHGNIFLDNTDQFPVLMGGWSFRSSAEGEEYTQATVTDPLTIIYE